MASWKNVTRRGAPNLNLENVNQTVTEVHTFRYPLFLTFYYIVNLPHLFCYYCCYNYY